MSKRKNRTKSKRPVATVQQPQHDSELLEQWQQLLEALEASKVPGMPDHAIDVGRAVQVLAQHPQLVNALDAIRQKEEARLDLMTDAYGSPSGISPQAANINGARWSGEMNDPVALTNAKLYRKWAEENEFVRAAINIRRKQVEAMKPICLPADPKKRYDRKLQQRIQITLDQPNELRDSWRTLIGPVLEDILTLDRGVILKNMTVDRKPVGMYAEDGACIRIYPAWSGDPKEPRYLYVSPNGKTKVPLRNDECICIIDNSANHRYGFSPIQALENTIKADLAATIAAANLMSMKPPPNALQIPKASPKVIQDIAKNYAAKIAGRKQLFFFGGPEAAHLFPLVYSARDQQFLEYQIYLGRKIAILFQISPQKLGILNDVNRSTANIQEEIDEDRGLIPFLLLLESYLNREFLADFSPVMPDGRVDLDALNLKIVFPEVSDAARKVHAKETIAMAQGANPNLPCMTLNMILAMLGQDPVEGGDTFYVPTSVGPMKWLSYDEDFKEMPQNQPKPVPVAPGQKPNNQDNQEGDDNSSDNQDGSQSKQDDQQEDDSNNQGKDTGSNNKKPKKAAQYDFRMPGQGWRADQDALFASLKDIPDDAKRHIPKAEKEKLVLEKSIGTLFNSKAKEGHKSLEGLTK